MLIVSCLAMAVIALLAYLLYRTVHEDRAERRELLTRIQHPEIVPRVGPTYVEPIEPEPDDSHLVGRVQWTTGEGDESR